MSVRSEVLCLAYMSQFDYHFHGWHAWQSHKLGKAHSWRLPHDWQPCKSPTFWLDVRPFSPELEEDFTSWATSTCQHLQWSMHCSKIRKDGHLLVPKAPKASYRGSFEYRFEGNQRREWVVGLVKVVRIKPEKGSSIFLGLYFCPTGKGWGFDGSINRRLD